MIFHLRSLSPKKKLAKRERLFVYKCQGCQCGQKSSVTRSLETHSHSEILKNQCWVPAHCFFFPPSEYRLAYILALFFQKRCSTTTSLKRLVYRRIRALEKKAERALKKFSHSVLILESRKKKLSSRVRRWREGQTSSFLFSFPIFGHVLEKKCVCEKGRRYILFASGEKKKKSWKFTRVLFMEGCVFRSFIRLSRVGLL